MNHRDYSGAIAVFCLGVVLVYVGWIGLHPPKPFTCGDETCEEAHP